MGRYLLFMVAGLMLLFNTVALKMDQNRVDLSEANSHSLAFAKARNLSTSGAYMAVSRMSLDNSWNKGFTNMELGGALGQVRVENQFSNASLSSAEKMVVSIGSFDGVSETTRVNLRIPPDIGKYALYATDEVDKVNVYNELGFKDASLLIENAGVLPAIDWDALESLALEQEAADGKGSHIIYSNGTGSGDDDEDDVFVETDGEVEAKTDALLSLRVLGAAIQSGSWEIPVTVKVKLTEPDGSSEVIDLFGGKDVDGGETWSRVVKPGTKMIVMGTAHYRPGAAYWSTHSSQVICVQNGERPPVFAPFGNQPPIEQFLSPVLDAKTGRVTIATNEVLYLYELGTRNSHSPAWDMQDLVILMTASADEGGEQQANHDKDDKKGGKGKKDQREDECSFYYKDKIPNVTIVYGDLKISGNTRMYGIYIVHGNVIMDGNVHVEGIIAMPDPGTVVMHGGGNPSIMNVTGGMFLNADASGTGNHVSVKYQPDYMSIFSSWQKKSGIMLTRWLESQAF